MKPRAVPRRPPPDMTSPMREHHLGLTGHTLERRLLSEPRLGVLTEVGVFPLTFWGVQGGKWQHYL